MKIPDVIRELRESRAMSRPELARRSNVSRSHLWHIERGHNTPNLRTLEKISASLGVGLRHFFSRSDAEILLEDQFVREVLPLLPHLNFQNRAQILRVLEAAPRGRRAA
jgi:transcriptional regulator with XRE-family HTH domain